MPPGLRIAAPVLLSGLALGCHPPDAPLALTIRPSSVISTVLTACWENASPATSWIEFGPGEGYARRTTAVGPETDVCVVLVGVPAGVRWHWRAATDAGTTSDEQWIETDPAPADLPVVTIDEGSDTSGSGYFLFGTDDPPAALIVDREGEPVWWRVYPDGRALNRVRVSLDSRAVVHQVLDNEDFAAFSAIERVPWDQESTVEVPTPLGHHDVLEFADQSYAWIAHDPRTDAQGRYVSGDDLELTTPQGTRQVWSAWDTLVPGDRLPYRLPGLDDAWDWTHCNGLAGDGAGGFVLSCRHLDTLFDLADPTGGGAYSVQWQLGGDASDYTFADGTPLNYQHGPYWDGEHLWVFDNRYEVGEPSRAIEYALADGVATPLWSRENDARTTVDNYGDPMPLPSGNVLVGWGGTGLIEELTADRERRWAMRLTGKGMTYASYAETLGGPE